MFKSDYQLVVQTKTNCNKNPVSKQFFHEERLSSSRNLENLRGASKIPPYVIQKSGKSFILVDRNFSHWLFSVFFLELTLSYKIIWVQPFECGFIPESQKWNLRCRSRPLQ